MPHPLMPFRPQEASSTCTQEMDFLLIEFPGIVKDIDVALETLGGMKGITAVGGECSGNYFTIPTLFKAMSSGRSLEMRSQFNNPYQASLTAERHNMNEAYSGELYLVVKIRRRRRRHRPQEEQGEELQMSCLGAVGGD